MLNPKIQEILLIKGNGTKERRPKPTRQLECQVKEFAPYPMVNK